MLTSPQFCNYSILQEVECFTRECCQVQPYSFWALTVGLLASFFVVNAPSESTIALEAFVHSISATSKVLIT